ncbi:MAG: DEAD/DEAH box helicase [Fimbriimonas ginsengisoli]|uniref:DEAD/DEAH box helicase n=1 Tax=Fimbriimonas ginsengisoli TaxID=1005039 RepID=A0A931LV18_FIMGI|nr:DEAD/DEAH box helicase [Fimbriimonas ginsengisoli]
MPEWLSALGQAPDYQVLVERLPAREARWATLPKSLPAGIAKRLSGSGIGRLFEHQALSVDLAQDGKDVVVVTGTNSGKTLCYALPMACMLEAEPAARALLVYPTKALAQDQLTKLQSWLPPSIRCAIYDGDTPTNQRASVRKLAHVVLTNPDMLHVGILPGHENWSKFLRSLRLVVLDEMHSYRGVFGSHVSGVVRRLLRLCEWHRARPQIVTCSATIGNPSQLFQRLTGRTGTIVDRDCSPQGERTLAFLSPADGDAEKTSANFLAAEIASLLVGDGRRTLVFSRARVTAELVLRYARERLEATDLPGEVFESYRGGYTADERRKIERALFDGRLLGLSTTNALELGIDVGDLDAVVLNGYPGTVSSFWQQAGRAGRGVRPSLTVFLPHDDPLERMLAREPGLLLERRNESIGINPENPLILAQQLRCAAHERPIAPSELAAFGPTALGVAEAMDRSGELEFRGTLFFYPSHEAPAPKVNIRGSLGEEVSLLIGAQVLGTMEHWRALQSAHEGAVYLHRGATYVVHELDLAGRRAHLAAEEPPYYTRSVLQSTIVPTVEVRQRSVGMAEAAFAGLTVTDQVVGYRKIELQGDRTLSLEALDLPAQTYETLGVRLALPPLDPEGDLAAQLGGVHGLEHALLAVAPLLAGCDRSDVGSAWYGAFPGLAGPALFVFDRAPGGVGLAERLFEDLPAWVAGARQLLAGCRCEDGCPGCLLSSSCNVANQNLDKRAAVRLLSCLA